VFDWFLCSYTDVQALFHNGKERLFIASYLSVSLSVRPSVCLHVSTRLPQNFHEVLYRELLFLKSRGSLNFLKSEKSNMDFTLSRSVVCCCCRHQFVTRPFYWKLDIFYCWQWHVAQQCGEKTSLPSYCNNGQARGPHCYVTRTLGIVLTIQGALSLLSVIYTWCSQLWNIKLRSIWKH
jgi:hypothetical protein